MEKEWITKGGKFIADIRELVSVEDVLTDEDMNLGPNGALVFCMEYLTQVGRLQSIELSVFLTQSLGITLIPL